MSKASIGAKVGTLIVGAIKGKKSAAATATAYAKTKASKVAVKAIPKTKFAEPSKASVKVKSAAKQIGNPVNQEKSIESMISSVSRGGLKTGGTLGKKRDHRVANSKQLKREPNSQKFLDEIAAMKKTKTVKINQNSMQAVVKTNRDARALKAANKPVSKNNRNRFGDGEMSAYLKSAKPARANRTRLGNTANKKGK